MDEPVFVAVSSRLSCFCVCLFALSHLDYIEDAFRQRCQFAKHFQALTRYDARGAVVRTTL